LAWAGLAFAAILMAPPTALPCRLRRARGTAQTEPKTASTPESSEEARDSGRESNFPYVTAPLGLKPGGFLG